MMRFSLVVVLAMLMGVLVACGGDDSSNVPEQLPTTIQDAGGDNAGDAQSEPAVPQASTNTPFPTQVPPPSPPPRFTLPPTFTPTPAPTLTPTPEPTSEGPTPIPDRAFEGCDGFGVDFELSQEQFVLGESPLIAWTPVAGADAYRVYVRDQFESERTEQTIRETSLQINPDVFTLRGRYSWTVEPLDSFGIQICPGRGESLLAVDG